MLQEILSRALAAAGGGGDDDGDWKPGYGARESWICVYAAVTGHERSFLAGEEQSGSNAWN